MIRGVIGASALSMVLACGPNATGFGTLGASDTAATDSTAGNPNPTTGSDASATGSVTGNGTNGSGGAPTTAATTGPVDVTTGSNPDSSDDGPSSGDPRPVNYPPCDPDADACPRPYTECFTPMNEPVSWCSHDCFRTEDCPDAPPDGTAVALCSQQVGRCVLDCSGNATCPTGMECVGLGPNGQAMRCGWPLRT